MKKQGWLLFFLLTLCVAASSSEAQNPEPEATVISVGKIDATWKGVLSIPIWAETNVFFVGTTPVVLPEDVKAFKLKVDWLGNNQTRLDEESSVIMKVEAEDPPFSGNWKMVFEKNEAVGCKKHSSFQKIILSDPVVQEKPEVRYKISLSSILSVGPRSGPKETYLTVKLSSIAYDTYTTIPFISLAILHDPNGDHSWSGIKASSCLLHLLSLQTGNRPVSINNQKELLFHDPKGSFRVKSNNKENYLEISFFPTIDITSEQTSEDSCLIGPGLGDVYLLARNLPIKLSLVETFSAKAKLSKLFFTIVSPEEAGLGPDKKFEILVVPAASLRFFEEGKPVFGTWQQYGITDSFREQLIKMNSGWDNVISPYEKDSSKYLGEAFLNSKDKTPIRWNQEILLPITIDSGIDVLPSFVEKLQLSLPDNNIPMSIIMNSKPYAKSTIPEDVVLSLEDNEQGGKFPNFFVFDAYLDKYFGTPLFITKDDKTTPADTRSLRMRSISSSPQEFWTGSYETPVISGQITTIEGKTLGGAVIYLKQKDTVVRKGISSPDGFYKISVPSDEEQYSLLVQCEGCEDVIIPAVAFSADKRDVVKNVSLPVAREQLAVDSRQSAVGSQQLTEKATVTTKPVAVVSEKATVTTKPAVVVPEKATTTIKPAPTVEEKPVEFTGIIKNGSFSSDTMCWNILKVGSGQIMNVSVLNDSDKYPHALDINRQGSGKQKGLLGLSQSLNLDVATHTLITLSAGVKVLSATLDSDGKKGGVYPVTMEITYRDKAGNNHSWRHGFLAGKRPNYPEIGELIVGNEWLAYKSPNLAMLKPRPAIITCVKVYGEGWGFHGRVANLMLVSEQATDIVISEEGVSRQLAVGSQQSAVSSQQLTEKATVMTKPAVVVPEKATATTKPAPVVTAKPTAVVSEKATITTKPAVIAPEKATVTTKPVAVVPEKATVTTKPVAVVPEKATITTKPVVAVPEKATITTKPAVVVPEKATVTTKPAPVVKEKLTAVVPEKATITTKPAAVASEQPAEETAGIIKNGNFSFDTKSWNMLKVGIGQTMNLSVVNDSNKYSHVLDINRQGSGKQKGLLGLSQSLNLDVATHTLITLSAGVKVLSATLDSDGKKGGVYPVTMEITYRDKAGNNHSWRHGFLAGKRPNYPEIGELIAGNEWLAYKSPNLAMLKPRPAVITCVKVYGEGWGFHGRVANLVLVSEKATDIVISEEVVATVSPQLIEKATATTKPVSSQQSAVSNQQLTEKATITTKSAPVVKEKPTAVVPEKATVTTKPAVVVPEKATVTTKPAAIVSEKATVTTKPAAVVPEKATVTTKPAAVVPEKATVTTKSMAVVAEKATVTTKPAVVVPEKATTTIKPAPTVEEKSVEFTGIIKNGSFSSDTMCWNILKVGSGQIMNVSVLNDSDKYPHALDINRQGSGKQKGLLGLSQSLTLDIATHTLITLSADVKVLSATLDSDGKKGGVYPVTMEIAYNDKAGQEHLWRHGFLAGKRPNYPEIGELIVGNEWVAFKSANLAMLKPRPAVITCVKVYGEGWGFHGRVANFVLVSEQATDIVISEEGVSRQLAVGSQQSAVSSQQLTEKATVMTKPAVVVPEKATATTKPAPVVTAKPTAVVSEKATITTKPAVVVPEKATVTTKPVAVVPEKATVTTKPVAVVPEKATITTKPVVAVPEKATITTKPAVVVPEKATVTTKPAPVVKEKLTAVVPEKATITTKPAAVASEQPAEETAGIIKNGNFSFDTKSWNMLKVGIGQTMNLSVVNDSNKYSHVLDINRQGSGKQKGLLGLSQSLTLDVATHTLITLSADVKVLSATLNSDGKKGGVYPVTMEITYRDKAGNNHSWRHGFLAGKRPNYPEIGELIAGNEWLAYKSPNLAMLKPRPAVITCVKVYGEGWGFHGRVANLLLVSEKATDIVISEEVVATVSPQLIEKATATTKPVSSQQSAVSNQQLTEKATITTKSAPVVKEKPTAVVPEKATVTTKPAVVVPEKATVTTKPAAIVSEKATVTTKPAAVVPEKATVTTKPAAVVPEKATVTTKSMAVVAEKATVTTKPAVVVPEKATTTIKPAPTVEEKSVEFTGIIKNGSFSSDTMCWNILKVGSGQIMNVSVLNDSDKYPHVLDINRQGSGKQKGLLGLSQSLTLDVATHTLITLSADVKVLSATLNSDGKKGGVYPVTMEITYRDKAGNNHSWRHGFLAGKRPNYPEIGELIAGNEWLAYKSPNLAMLKPRPAVITCVKVYGEGWGFHGRVANLLLVSEKATDIVILEEVVSRQEAVGSQQLTEKATITTKPAVVAPEKATVTTKPTAVVPEKVMVTTKPAVIAPEKATVTTKPAAVVTEKATTTTKPVVVVPEKATVTTKPVAVVAEKATVTTKPAVVVLEKATITTKPVSQQLTKEATTTTKSTAVVPEEATVIIEPVAISRQLIKEATIIAKPAAIILEEATVTTKLMEVVLEKATVTIQPAVIIPEEATVTTKPVAIVSEPEEVTTTIKPATIVSEKAITTVVVEKPAKLSEPVTTGQITPEEMKEILEQVALPEMGTPSTGTIKNNNFSAGLKYWQPMKSGDGELRLKVVKESSEYPFVLEFNRKDGEKTKGRLGVSQDVNLSVADNKLITVAANIKVLSATLDSDGTRGGVYPVTMEMEYSDKAGNTHSWRHGFLAGKRLNYAGIGELIVGNKWITYKSPNLAMLKPRPAIITCVKVYGEGWGFHGRVANLMLVSEKASDIVIPEEVGTALAAVRSEKATVATKPVAVISEKAMVTTKPAPVVEEKPAVIAVEQPTVVSRQLAVGSQQLTEEATITTKPASVNEKTPAAIAVEQPVVVSQQLTEEATITTKFAPVVEEKPATVVAETPTPETSQPSSQDVTSAEKTPETLIKNGDFTNGLNSWEETKDGVAITKIEVVNDSSDYPFVLSITRKESNGQKGFLGLKQKIGEKVDDYTLLAVVMDVKVVFSSLENDGTEGGEYPLCVEISYEDCAGMFCTWRQGFLYTGNINYPKIGERVPKDKWYIYLSGNLLKLEPKPKILKEIKIYGQGQDFVARITNLSLIGGKMKIPRGEE